MSLSLQMKLCPLCDRRQPDSAFWNRIYKKQTPLCSPCFQRWREHETDKAMQAKEWGRELPNQAVNPWQFGARLNAGKKKKQESKQDVRERLLEIDRKFNLRLPVNPSWLNQAL